MPSAFAGRVALVTGSGNGIGRATARQLAALGATVGVNDLKPEFVEKVVKEIGDAGGQAIAVVENVATREGMRRAVLGLAERAGRLDVLVNNAAAFVDWSETATGADLGAARAVLEVNLFGAWRLTQALLPLLSESPRPRVVNVSSGAGSSSTPSAPA